MENAVVLRTRASSSVLFSGKGYLGGDLPTSGDPDAPDGRARIMNVPARVRVVVLERVGFQLVASTISKPDGTWRVPGLSLDYNYLVIGLDERGQQNAAVQDWVRPAVLNG